MAYQFRTGYRWTKSARRAIVALVEAARPMPISWLPVGKHLRLDAALWLLSHRLVEIVRDGVIGLTPLGTSAVKFSQPIRRTT